VTALWNTSLEVICTEYSAKRWSAGAPGCEGGWCNMSPNVAEGKFAHNDGCLVPVSSNFFELAVKSASKAASDNSPE